MRLKEERLLITLEIIFLIGLTLISIFIQITDNKINWHYTNIMLDENIILHDGSMALSEYLAIIDIHILDSFGGIGIENSSGDVEQIKSEEEIDKHWSRYQELLKRSKIKGDSVVTRLNNPLLCYFDISCSTLKTILYSLQFTFLSISIIILILILKGISGRLKNKG